MSKLSKLRRSPERFFSESSHRWVRALGPRVVPALVRSDTALSLLDSPVLGLSESNVPILRSLARWEERRRARKRAALLLHAAHPTVSVVMAARNAAETIEAALESLLGQTYPVHEVLVVDDASDDRTVEIVSDIAARHPTVRLFRSEHQRGAAIARNVGLSHTSGAYLTFQDADDRSHPERIERQLAALVERRGHVCICNAVRETPEGQRVTVNGKRFARAVISMMFPRDPVFRTVGYMRPLTIGEDGEYFERICAAFAWREHVELPEILYRARFSPNSLFFSNGTTTVADHEVTFVHSADAARAFQQALAALAAIREGHLQSRVESIE